jgi:hypothetical protein
MNIVSISLGVALILSLLVNYCLISVNEKSGKRNEELFDENESLKNDIDRAYSFARQAAKDYTAISEKVGILLDQEWERVPPTNFEVIGLLDAKIAQKREADNG